MGTRHHQSSTETSSDGSLFARTFSRRRGVVMVAMLVTALVVVALLATEDLVPKLLGLAAELATVMALVALLVFCELARRDGVAARAGLIRSEQRLSFAQTAARIGSWEVDAEGAETWSSSFRDLLGIDADAPASTEAFRALVHPDDQAEVTRKDRKMLSEPGEHENEFRIRRPDGEVRYLLARGLCIVDASGVPERVFGAIIDLTERKVEEETNRRLEQQLIQAQRLETVGRLAGGVAHDFNNLLVAIRGFGERALGRAARGEEGVSRDLEEVIAAADRGAAITRQLLALGRRQVLNPEVLDLNEVVRGMGALLQRLIGDNVECITVLGTRAVVVRADRGQLEQVIMNLAVNGRDAMQGGGRLTILVGTADRAAGSAGEARSALLSVTDDGSGIEAATASQMFEPFFTTKGNEGTGLGLATVHGIIAQSGGHVAVDTEPGRGSTFTVHLPLCREEPLPFPVPPSLGESGGTETILLVEDDPTVSLIVSSMLKVHGYEILDAASGEEAILCFENRERPIPIVLTDLIMSGLDGRQTAERIRAVEPGTRVLYMSGYSEDVTIRSGGLGRGTGFIQKPFSGDELASRVRELLDTTVGG